VSRYEPGVGLLTETHDLSRLTHRRSRAISQPRSRQWRVVADISCSVARLVFTTSAVDAPHRIETPAPLLFRGIPVRAVLTAKADPKIDLDVLDSSLGVHRSPLRRHDGHCVHIPPGPSPRLRFGTTTSRTVLRSCRSSRLQRFPPQRADPKTHSFDCPRVCCTPQPAMGFTTFRTSCSASRPSVDPKVVDLAVHPEVVPCGEDPSKRSPPRQPDHVVTASRPFGRDRVHRLVCPPAVPSRIRFRVATVRWAALRPQGFLPPRSPLRCARRCRCAPARCSLGLWIDSFPMLPRDSRCPAFPLDVSPGGPNRFGVPGPERRGKAGCFGPVWLLRPVLKNLPEGKSQRVAVAPASPEGGTSAALRHA